MSQPPASGIYRAVWTIIDPERSRGDLIAEAEPELRDFAAADGVVLTGPVEWDTTRHGYDIPIPGWERWLGYVLVAEAPAQVEAEPDPEPEPDELCEGPVIDWLAVDLALTDERVRTGERPVTLTAVEKKAAVQRGERCHHMTRSAISRRLRLSGATVNRYAEAELPVDADEAVFA